MNMFSFREFVKQGFIRAIGHQPDYWIVLNAAGYAEKGVLTMEDLADIEAVINHQYATAEDGGEVDADT
jgi:hypothetical protein